MTLAKRCEKKWWSSSSGRKVGSTREGEEFETSLTRHEADGSKMTQECRAGVAATSPADPTEVAVLIPDRCTYGRTTTWHLCGCETLKE
eukprot:scaffold7987_cov200-Cylindrotheca_fusiformis.AAC.22